MCPQAPFWRLKPRGGGRCSYTLVCQEQHDFLVSLFLVLPSLCLASPTIGGPCLTTKKCLPPLSCLLTNSFEAILLLVIFSFFFTTKTFRIRVCGSAGKESACTMENLGSILVLGRSPGEEKGYPLQYSVLENSTNCLVHGVAKSRT